VTGKLYSVIYAFSQAGFDMIFIKIKVFSAEMVVGAIHCAEPYLQAFRA
jgi:hypothetical protein